MTEEARPIENPKNSPSTQRRAWVRIRSEPDRSQQQDAAAYSWVGSLQEVSYRGITLNLRRRFELGAILTVELAPKENGPRCLAVQVLHATQQGGDRWIIGCAFAKPPSEQQLQDFIED